MDVGLHRGDLSIACDTYINLNSGLRGAEPRNMFAGRVHTFLGDCGKRRTQALNSIEAKERLGDEALQAPAGLLERLDVDICFIAADQRRELTPTAAP